MLEKVRVDRAQADDDNRVAKQHHTTGKHFAEDWERGDKT
jgi:hypothetical protein